VTARGLVLMDVLGLRRVMSNPSDQEHRGRSRPTGALRLAFRLPIYLYRLGLGQLLGHRFMLLTHRGRRSGRVYQTALEVVRYDPSLRETVVASGWGERSDWYRNLKAHPALEIRTGRERYAPEQRFLAPEEVYREIVDYERRHPWAVRIVPSLLGFRLDGSDTARRAFANSVRMVVFRPRQGPSSRGRSTAASPWRPAADDRDTGVYPGPPVQRVARVLRRGAAGGADGRDRLGEPPGALQPRPGHELRGLLRRLLLPVGEGSRGREDTKDGGPRMRLPNTAHTSRPWRIHEIARDFRLEDVWALPTPGGPDDFPRLVRQIAAGDPSRSWSGGARALWALRWKVGELLRWDRPDAGLGSRVPTLRDRLPADLRDAPSGPDFDPFTSLYLLEDEFAAEMANRTVHAVMHLGWIPDGAAGYRGQMAVLLKPNGLFGAAYMAAIKPFRYVIVYPALMRQIGREWRAPPPK
jgi:deazaflavin-dependent oxidoreductase (nitroreductase family)